MEFGKRLRKLRQESFKQNKTVNIDSISKHLQITRGHLMKVERGERQPFDFETIRKFCLFIKRPDLISELYESSIRSRGNVVFDLDNVSELKRESVLKLAREWEDPNSDVWEFLNEKLENLIQNRSTQNADGSDDQSARKI